jgi:hypothetical protein
MQTAVVSELLSQQGLPNLLTVLARDVHGRLHYVCDPASNPRFMPQYELWPRLGYACLYWLCGRKSARLALMYTPNHLQRLIQRAQRIVDDLNLMLSSSSLVLDTYSGEAASMVDYLCYLLDVLGRLARCEPACRAALVSHGAMTMLTGLSRACADLRKAGARPVPGAHLADVPLRTLLPQTETDATRLLLFANGIMERIFAHVARVRIVFLVPRIRLRLS